ncbi:uncharacterized protein [Asterias amurensis]|uniref:uncharacterized protein n=1 Tax=Asterias amurensis TaxID=7602 RepID=UPI003AB573B5
MLACDILISNSTPSVIVYTSCNNHARHFFTPDNHKVNMNNSVSKCTFLTVYVCLLFSTATVNGTICLLESNGNCTRHPGPATKTSTGAVYAVRKATAQGVCSSAGDVLLPAADNIPEGAWLRATSQRVPDYKPHPRGCLTTSHIPEGA